MSNTQPVVNVTFGDGRTLVVDVPSDDRSVTVEVDVDQRVTVEPVTEQVIEVDAAVETVATIEVEPPRTIDVDVTQDRPHVVEIPLVGPRGPAANVESLYYTHVQDMPSDTWEIEHPFPSYPSVAVVDSTGRVVTGDVIYVSSSVIRVEFSVAFAGNAYLS